MPRKSILIVDDEALVRRTARSLLCEVVDVCHEAENGQQALEKVKKLRPDVVLLDISMPVMNGLRAAYEIRQVAPSTKIIFFTVDGSGDARGAAHALGAHAFVTKSEGPENCSGALGTSTGSAFLRPYLIRVCFMTHTSVII